jgi:quercetin dioxygenase-like cupin family protein
MKTFSVFDLKTDCLAELCDQQFPTAFHAWNEKSLTLKPNGTHFGYVYRGQTVLQTPFGEFRLRERMYFCVPDGFVVNGGTGVIISRLGFKGIFSLGGIIENQGRLRYIDGCTDTLLIAPLLQGDPCLNALFFPPNITQTPHTHPSVRVGMVAQGSGECVLPDGVIALNAGKAFIIPPDTLHSFNTQTNEMIVIAYHPDSDFGATNENHPMINRTMVKGVSASQIAAIQTR